MLYKCETVCIFLNKFIGLGLNCISVITKLDALKVSQSEIG